MNQLPDKQHKIAPMAFESCQFIEYEMEKVLDILRPCLPLVKIQSVSNPDGYPPPKILIA